MINFRSVLGSITRLRIALATLTCAILLPVVPAPAAGADDGRRRGDLSDLRVCDLSACYLALGVVDSDADGVSDADEISLGYDPLDPASTPPLALVLKATLGRKLPTYELGYGTWAVFPEEFVRGLEKNWLARQDLPGGIPPTLPSEVFGIPTRQSSFALAGIGDGLLKQFGIEMPWVNGLSFGLSARDHDGKDMGIDLGRFNGSWYGAYDGVTAWWAAGHGGATAWPADDDGTRRTSYGDGSSSVTTPDKGCEDICTASSRTEYYDSGLNTVGSSTDEAYYDMNGVFHTDRTERDKNDRVVKEEHTTHQKNDQGGTTVKKETTEYHRDKNGNVTGTTKTTKETSTDKDGKKTSSEKTQKCDANGQNCTDAMTTGDEFTGPALPGTAWLSHQEVAAALEKMLTMKGATVTPAQDAPDVIGVVTDDDVNAMMHHRDLVSLFAGEDVATHAGAMVISAGWNEAKPETRPDLPSPLEGATGGGTPGGCASGPGTC
ncbi:hypothetical protein Cme02nite_00710 [Catellatospora methionotrophica]|uniref:CBS domain-containing protein n=1 Tax=Catellatospora methionotrophica TaxID=121620 RepID=A0A8J3L9U2_9ACTN|nr:thrombospondin type 3 repeat-containing protein [Catellatospora methionotrophica]GIG11739.1 hypothetical protein Cme02nite_00710 [Catellatospora methionotrophica]